jgi:ATP-dependent DNA helicase RecQ
MKKITFFDLEVHPEIEKILDIGAIHADGTTFHKNSMDGFSDFIIDSEFICGHNILAHDLKYLKTQGGKYNFQNIKKIDTLLFSPLLFPKTPYHRLLKDDKIQSEEINNPLNDSIKAKDLFFDEVTAFKALDDKIKTIYYNLLYNQEGFSSFFDYVDYTDKLNNYQLEEKIQTFFQDKICNNASISKLIEECPVSLVYSLSLLNCNDRTSITPPWVLRNYPEVERVVFLLRNNPCITGCNYCNEALNPISALKQYFGFNSFRSYGDEPLQANAVKATIHNKSILSIFPTGGGKSITFQIPALMSGRNAKALTVIISPLQSLMKDQVDNLEKKGITDAVTINGLLDPIERSKSIERVENGSAFLLYISPESLRSVTIERLLLKRKIARFVIDEAHCFSSWGQDFRVDYLYIGDFINELQKKKNLGYKIPISCFTATAKLKVIEDIQKYFKTKLDLDLDIFRANASRTNLQYRVFQKDNEEDKYNQLRSLIEIKDAPAIVYVSRTKRAYQLAKRLSEDGFMAKPYHGKMDKDEKTANQNAFMNNEVNIMVATSAFGMGVDKSNVEKVIHYDISDSLENYIQEAGRAGRDETISAECFILFNEEDLDKHFILLNQTKISSKEINQIWKAIKDLTKTRERVSNSSLEIARKAGWDENINEIETRVTTAIAALEDAGYLKRGQNFPRVFANSILSQNAEEAILKINDSTKFTDKQKVGAVRIIKKLFSSKSKRLSTEEVAESRVDYISDQLGIVKEDVIRIIELLRDEEILAHTKDLTAFIRKGESSNRSFNIVNTYIEIETDLLSLLNEEESIYHLKELNEHIIAKGHDSNVNKIKTILNFWAIKNFIKRQNQGHSKNHIGLACCISKKAFEEKINKRHKLSRFITNYLYNKSTIEKQEKSADDALVEFSVLDIKNAFELENKLFNEKTTIDEVEDSLFYLSRVESLKIEGGFLVVYNRLTIDRLEKNNRIQYKESDYEKLKSFYQQKVQQIHIVGEYAKKMIRNYKEALQFVEDYFSLNYVSFLNKYFPGSRQDEIKRTLTPEKFIKLFGELSLSQFEIIKDASSQYIVVAAGPGSGKTKVLVHKLASLLLTEDIKHEQLLMLAFSRAAVTEFKKKLLDIIGNAANYIEIKTFHSYSFDLLGRVGNLSQSDDVIKTAVQKIRNAEIETSYITKAVLVIDEAQDMNADEFDLVKSLMEQNEEMRVILVGDDDQNIYEFRGSDSKYMQELISSNSATKYELTLNYRSKQNIVAFANHWIQQVANRIKSEPGIPNKKENGKINITHYKSNNLIVPVVNDIINTDLAGSTCVLTKTNEEASQLLGLLLKNGFPAKLIQSNDGFHLGNLFELRCFSDLILKDENSPHVSDEDWEEAKRIINKSLNQSSKLPLVNAIIDSFEKTNTKRKYKSDWKAFVLESKIEDFLDINNETIYISTIHKSKGKEFENVFMMLNGFSPDTNEKKKQFYVGVTRTKNNLSIHYNGDFLNKITAEALTLRNDINDYPEPEQIVMQLTHKDVNLGYFDTVQNEITGLFSGSQLKINPEGLQNNLGKTVLKFSRKFSEELATKLSRGYKLQSATVNFKIYWYNDKAEQEIIIILPGVVLKK